MTTPEQSQFRIHPPRAAQERPMYQAWLEFHRGTLLWKCAGLTPWRKPDHLPPADD